MGQLTYKIIIKKEHVRKERNMSKRVYISADYSESNGDRAVVDELHKWGKDKLHKVDYVDTAEVVSGSVSENPDCRPCDLKKEFNSQIKHFYFVAINDINDFGKPIGQSIENVSIALNAVTDAIKRMGHYDTLCIPLLGSGKAAIQGATKENVFQQTVDYFVQSEDKLANKLIISINPKDYINNKIDLNRMEKYLDYQCEFGKLCNHASSRNAV